MRRTQPERREHIEAGPALHLPVVQKEGLLGQPLALQLHGSMQQRRLLCLAGGFGCQSHLGGQLCVVPGLQRLLTLDGIENSLLVRCPAQLPKPSDAVTATQARAAAEISRNRQRSGNREMRTR